VLLRRLRERALVSQEELAARAGLSVRAIGNLEQGRVAQPRGESVWLLADALGLVGPERQRFEEAARQRFEDAGRPLPEGLPGVSRRSWPASQRPAPCQLPPAVADFTGRTEQVTQLGGLLASTGDGRAGAAVVVSAVAGHAGIGKTALAIHVAHQLRDRFPDGQLYVNLRGAQQQSLPATLVLGRFLRALGVNGAAIPEDGEEREALYRALLADRRVLVVLDNAASEAQLRPRLPGTPGCGVLVTSRARWPASKQPGSSTWTCWRSRRRSGCWAGSPGPSGWPPNQTRPPRSWASAVGCRWPSGWPGRGWPPGRAGH
jgi:transcriptional regulator with XRE-family HTH domain